MNDNDDGRELMPAQLVTAGRFVCVSTVSFGLPWRVRSVRETGKAECPSFVQTRFIQRGQHRTL